MTKPSERYKPILTQSFNALTVLTSVPPRCSLIAIHSNRSGAFVDSSVGIGGTIKYELPPFADTGFILYFSGVQFWRLPSQLTLNPFSGVINVTFYEAL